MPHHDESSARENRVNEAIAAYLQAIDRGESPDREKLLAEHDDIADDLREFFAGHGQLQALAGNFNSSSLPNQDAASAQVGSAPGPVPASNPSVDSPTILLPGIGTSGTESAGAGSDEVGRQFLLHEIARGGMGVVFKGRDSSIGRDIAVKVLLERHHGETELLQRFVEEAQIAGQLQHPGVTPVYAMGQLPDQRPYFTMKLVKGETLSRLLKDRPDPTHDRLRFLKIFEQVCQTLAYAHSRGVIHRDLKPGNIMVGAFGEVQVMDWGLGKVLGAAGSNQKDSAPVAPANASVIRTARSSGAGDSDRSSSQTLTGSVLGTPAYMPPEQAVGQTGSLDQRSDVFGLGAILCEILTGQPPYTGSDAWQVQIQAIRGDLTDAFDRLDHCGADPQLTNLARRALAPLPADRPADAGVLAAELTTYLEGVETRLRQAELAEVQAETRAVEERRRRRQTLVYSGAVLAVLVGGVIGTSWGLIRAGRALQEEAKQRKLAEESERAAHAATQAEHQAKETVRRELFVADLELAGQVWDSESGTAQYVDNLLLRHIPSDGQTDLREFAWRLQWSALRKHICILKDHDLGARLVAFANDRELVTLGGDLTLRHWELPIGKKLRSDMLRDAPFVSCRAISSDAHWIALGGGNTVHVFDARTGEKIHEFPGRALVLSLNFSVDGKKLAAVWGTGEAQVWNTNSGKQLSLWHLQDVDHLSDLERVAVTPDGRNLYLIGYPENDQITRLGADQTESPIVAKHESSVYSIALTRDGQLGATGDANGLVCLWNTETHEQRDDELRVYRGKVTALQFSPDARLLAAGVADGLVTVWDVANRRRIHSFKGHLGRIHDLSFLSDGQLLASASQDGDVRVWSLAASGQSRVIGVHESHVFSVAWSADGRYLAVGTGEKSMSKDAIVKVWEPGTGKLVHEIRAGKGRALALAFSPDGRRLATGGFDSTLRLWDLDSGKLLYQRPGPVTNSDDPRRQAIGSLAISPDGTMIAAGFGRPSHHQSDYEQVALVWDLASGRQLQQLPGHFNTICSVAFSPDGTVLATASDDQQVKLWSVSDWRPLGTLSGTERFKSVAFSPQGDWIVTGGESGAITVWETASRRPIRQLIGHTSAASCLVFSSDGRTLASSGWDNTVKLWDPVSGRETRTLREHDDWVSCLAFSPAGNSLATASFDKTVRVWDAASFAEIAADDGAERSIGARIEQRRRFRQDQRSASGTFPIPATLLDQYAGSYVGTDVSRLTIDRQGDCLAIHPIKGARGAAVPLYANSDHEFLSRDREIDVMFLKDEQGQVTRVIVYQAGEAFEAQKLNDHEQLNPTGGNP